MAVQRRFEYFAERLLVEMAQRGSLEAYDELVYRFRDGVLVVIRQRLDGRASRGSVASIASTVSTETVQDVAQETFLLAFRALGQLRDPGKFAGWLHTIARHRAQRLARRRDCAPWEAEPTSLDGLAIEPADTQEEGPLASLLRNERQEAVRQLLAGISPDCQTVLQLFYYEQWTAARIAEFLSLPLTTVKWRLRYGRKQIQERLHLFETATGYGLVNRS